MKFTKRFFILLIIGLSSNAFASTYLRPKASYLVPVSGGDGAYTLGAALGYEIMPMFSLEFGYSRLMGTGSGPDGDILSGEGILSFPLAIVTPYASGGFGGVHFSTPVTDTWSTAFILGAGIDFTALPFISIGVGLNYGVVFDGEDYIQPGVTVGIGF